MSFRESNSLSEKRTSKLSFLEPSPTAFNPLCQCQKLMWMRWSKKRGRGISLRLSPLNTYIIPRPPPQQQAASRNRNWKKWRRTRSKKWALLLMKWGRTFCRRKMLMLCHKVWCIDKLRWWIDRLMFLRKTKSKSATSSITWWAKVRRVLRALEISNKMCSMRTEEWCLKWWHP